MHEKLPFNVEANRVPYKSQIRHLDGECHLKLMCNIPPKAFESTKSAIYEANEGEGDNEKVIDCNWNDTLFYMVGIDSHMDV